MKFIVSSLFLALLVIAANAASLEKVENVETKSVADNVGPASAEPAAPTPIVKAEPAQIVEAKSEEVVEEKAVPVEKVEADAAAEPKLLGLGGTEPVEAEQTNKVRKPPTSLTLLASWFHTKITMKLNYLAAGHHSI